MKLAIIEDEQTHRELLSNYLQEWGTERSVSLCGRGFPNAESFLFVWEEERDFDVLFVDIQMKEMNGMEMARKIRQQDPDIAIVFTTGIADYMEEGYEVEALHYLLKPLSRKKLFQCMDKVLKRSSREEFILIQAGEELQKLAVERVMYVEARGHGCVVEYVPRAGEIVQIEASESISELEKKLEKYGFVKCHRSYLCRIGSIQRIDRTELVLDDGSRIPVSRRLYSQVNRAFIQYFRRENGDGNAVKVEDKNEDRNEDRHKDKVKSK